MAKKYKIKCRLYIDGVITVRGNDKLDAAQKVRDHLHLCLDGKLHTSDDDYIVDWTFPIHFEKKLK